MRRALTRLGYAALLLTIAAVAIFFFVLPDIVDRNINRVSQPPPYQASPEATSLHREVLVADMHADSLLWGRVLAE